MRRAWTTLLLASALAPAARGQDMPPSTDEARLTLEEAVSRALLHDPTVVAAAGAVRAAESGERVALGAYLPSVSASTTTSRTSSERFNPQTGTSVTGSSTSLNAGVSTSSPSTPAGR